MAKITIGKYSNVQDNVVIHGGDVYKEDNLIRHVPVEIGNYVTVAHRCVVHGSKIGDVSMIGMTQSFLTARWWEKDQSLK